MKVQLLNRVENITTKGVIAPYSKVICFFNSYLIENVVVGRGSHTNHNFYLV